MNGPYVLFSVESRKGGVGKTTMALSLARLLSKKEYSVLLIDCDITGTSVTTAACHSSIWREEVNPLQLEGKDINLLDFFKNKYLTGKSDGKNICEESVLNSSKINLLGSEIYSEDGEVIISPSVLTDELHSFWFVSMLKELADSFSSKQAEDRKVAIIIDNSPGYVGIGHAIHEWIGELRPSRAKCLMVSSLDRQDLQSCESATREIENTVNSYLDAIQYYLDVKNEIEPTVTYDSFKGKTAESFFYNLVDKNEEENTNVDRLSVEKYVALVLNKIPTEYANAAAIKTMLESFDGANMEHVLSACQSGNNIIEENPFLSQQFYVNRKEHKTEISSLQEKWNEYESVITKAYSNWTQIGPLSQFLAKIVSSLDNALDDLPVGDIEYFRRNQLLWLLSQIRKILFEDQRLIDVLWNTFSLVKMKSLAENHLNLFLEKVEKNQEDWPESIFMRAAHDYLVKPCSTSSKIGFAQRIVVSITCSIMLDVYIERLKNGYYREGDYIFDDKSIDTWGNIKDILLDPKMKNWECIGICQDICNSVLYFTNRLILRLSHLGAEVDFWKTILDVQYKNPMVSVLTPEMRTYMSDRFVSCSQNLDFYKAMDSVQHEYEIYNTELTLQEYVLKQWGL